MTTLEVLFSGYIILNVVYVIWRMYFDITNQATIDRNEYSNKILQDNYTRMKGDRDQWIERCLKFEKLAMDLKEHIK